MSTILLKFIIQSFETIIWYNHFVNYLNDLKFEQKQQNLRNSRIKWRTKGTNWRRNSYAICKLAIMSRTAGKIIHSPTVIIMKVID
jgi:hypothetical protein